MKLDHVGVIVKHQRQVEGLQALLGLTETGRGTVERYQAECIMLEGHGIRIECILSSYGPLAAYNHGHGGIHHLAVELEHDEGLPDGTPLLEAMPVQGICGMSVNFIPPFLAGFPIEIVDRRTGHG